MHATSLILVPLLLPFIATVFGLPPLILPNGSDNETTPLGFYNSTLSSNLNLTTPLTGLHTPTCYTQGHRSAPVDFLSCYPIIETLAATEAEYIKPRLWKRQPKRGQAVNMRKEGCRMVVIDGADNDRFSFRDVVEVMEDILTRCQPEVKAEYAGTGGQMGVGRYGFVVRVVGVKGGLEAHEGLW